MDEYLFWELIESFDWSKDGNDDAVMQLAIDRLSQMDITELQSFDEILAAKLFGLDTWEHARQTGFGTEHYSVDSFLYIRCRAVANGNAFYQSVLADPLKIPSDLEFESLIYLTGEAARKKGIDDYFADTQLSYETFSNEKGWEGTHLPDNLPPGHKPKHQR
jgi:hypothetical protein